MVPILQAHDLRARALELALELGDLRRRLRVRFHHALDHRLRRPRGVGGGSAPPPARACAWALALCCSEAELAHAAASRIAVAAS